MRFSIIMPVWNRADMVKKSIDSVLAQDFKDYELFIIDDGSTDNLEEVVKPYLSESITYHKLPHSGASAARNFGLSIAQGDYIAYLDSDNIWHSDFLSTMQKTLSTSKKKVAYCKFNRFARSFPKGNIGFERVIGSEFNFRQLLNLWKYDIDLNAFVHAKQCTRYVGIFDERLTRFIDMDLVIRITARYEPVFISQVLVDHYFNVADNTITRMNGIRQPLEIIDKKKLRYPKSINLTFDGNAYSWEEVSDEKYYNWVKMSNRELNTTDFTPWGYPYMLQIEPTNMCNLSCPLCPTGRNELGRKPQHMSLKEFKSIIDDMQKYLLFIILWDWGEPFMNPELPQMIKYATERGIKIVTSTNAHFLHDDVYVKAILQSGLTTLIVAIDSLNEDNYKVYREKGNLSIAVSGLKNLMRIKEQIKSPTAINMRMVVMKQNEHEVDDLRQLAKTLNVDTFTIKTLNPSCGSNSLDTSLIPDNPEYRRYEYREGKRIRRDTQCRRIWGMSNIFSNGDVVPCCYDYNSEMKIGNINNKPFTEIWDSPRYRGLRKILYYQKNSISKCNECTINFKLSKKGWFVEVCNFQKEKV